MRDDLKEDLKDIARTTTGVAVPLIAGAAAKAFVAWLRKMPERIEVRVARREARRRDRKIARRAKKSVQS